MDTCHRKAVLAVLSARGIDVPDDARERGVPSGHGLGKRRTTGGPVAVLGGLSPRRRAFVVVVAALATALLAALLVPKFGERSGGEVAPERSGVVVLVPGYGGGTGSLQRLAERIRDPERPVTVMDLPGDGTGDLHAQAAALDRAVDGASAGDGAPVDLVGFSAGGVVVRLWVQEYDGAPRARRVVTLGSPHHGTSIAAAGAAVVPGACPAACRQLAPGSRLLAGMESPVPTPPAWLSVWTADDRTVRPPESARLPGAVNVELQSICATARPGHGGLPTDPTVTRLVIEALGPGPLATPASGC